MKKILLLLLLSNVVMAQNFQDFAFKKQWMLITDSNVIEDKVLRFSIYDKSKLTINNMVWEFKSDGSIAYDYQSAEDVEACAGVDFLDLDLDESNWRYNKTTNLLTLTLKGGYASIDDFVVRKEYRMEYINGNPEEIILTENRLIFHNDLTRFKPKR